MFWCGLIVGIFVGATIGAIAMGYVASRLND